MYQDTYIVFVFIFFWSNRVDRTAVVSQSKVWVVSKNILERLKCKAAIFGHKVFLDFEAK